MRIQFPRLTGNPRLAQGYCGEGPEIPFVLAHCLGVLAFSFVLLSGSPAVGCVFVSSQTFSGVTATGATLDWESFCSSATLTYAQVDEDPSFLTPITSVVGGPPALFGISPMLVPNTVYYARVATNSFMMGSLPLGSTRTLAAIPVSLAPTVLSSYQLRSEGGANGNPAGTLYEHQISTDEFSSVLMSTFSTGVSMVWDGLTPNMSHSFRMRAANDDGVWTSSVSVGSATTFAELPGLAGHSFENIALEGFRVLWTSGTARWNPAETTYEVQVSTHLTFGGTIVTVSTTALHADVTGLIKETLYYSRVRAVNRDFAPTGYTMLGATSTAPMPYTEGGSSTTVQSPDGSFSVIVPTGTFLEDYRVFLSTDPVGSPLGPPEIPSQIAAAEIKLQENEEVFRTVIPDSFAEIRAESALGDPLETGGTNALTVTFVYPALNDDTVDTGAGPRVRAQTLAVYRLNETKGLWVRLPSSHVDTDAHTVTASAYSVGVFSLVGQQDTSLETAFAYPVPFRAKRGDISVTFGDLSQRAAIRIFSASGGLVQTLEELDGDGELEWDVKDSEGDPLPSGVYFFLIESSADKKRGKLVILR
jgi:hypothetical protein